MHGQEVVEDALELIVLHTMILQYKSTDQTVFDNIFEADSFGLSHPKI